jgi:hypothetical protein
MSVRIPYVLPIVLVALAAGGCAMRPVVVQAGQLYVGAFSTAHEIHPAGSEYHSVRGVGVAAGLQGVGLGYFRRESVSVPRADVPHRFDTPLADVEVAPATSRLPLLSP